jgi:alpha-tubulin suppressor-like RCC1 family protein
MARRCRLDPLVLCLLVAGCSLDDRVPNAHLACDPQKTSCPAGFRCVTLGARSVCCRGGNCGLDGDAPFEPASVDGGPTDGAPAAQIDGESDVGASIDDGLRTDGIEDSVEPGGDARISQDAVSAADAGDVGPALDGGVPALDAVVDKPAPITLDDGGGSMDAPSPGLALGVPCSDGQVCTSGRCADGVCCDEACSGSCESCNEPGSPGKCVAASGTPRGARPDCRGQAPCKGTCDGTNRGACAYPGSMQECAPPSCQGGVERTRSVCDGTGNCPAQTPVSCGAFPCGPTACAGTCSASQPCTTGNVCSGGKCVPKLPDGEACSVGSLCASGSCVDGKCCASASCGPCQACTGASGTCATVTNRDDSDSCVGTCDAAGQCHSKQGQPCQTSPAGCATGTFCSPDGYCCNQACTGSCMACDIPGQLGLCTPVASGAPHGNRTSCGSGGCAGTCAGRPDGQCDYPTASCGAATCSGGHFVPEGACMSGSCVAPPQDCAGGFVCAGSSCKTACSSNVDCLPNYYCASGTCHLDAIALAQGPAALHTCALLADGSGRCWGDNLFGDLGNSTASMSTTPVVVTGLSGATTIVVGGRHSCAIVPGRAVSCWGALNDVEQFPTATTVPVAISGLAGVIGLTAGGMHACAVLSTGEVKCWGVNKYGALGNGTTMNSTAPVSVSGIANATSVSAGRWDTCAGLSDGTVKCWGGMDAQQLTPLTVSGLTDVARVSLGDGFSCALLTTGAVKCWGANTSGQLGDGTYMTSPTPVDVHGVTVAVDLAPGRSSACMLLAGGPILRCWGANEHGQLGTGTMMMSSAPLPVSNLANATAVTAGYAHACAVVPDGSVKCWGWNQFGQLGSTGGDSLVPVPVTGW